MTKPSQKTETAADKLARFNANVPADLLHRARIKATIDNVTFRDLIEGWLRDYVENEESGKVESDESQKVENNLTLNADALAALQAVSRGFQSLMAQIEPKDRPQ